MIAVVIEPERQELPKREERRCAVTPLLRHTGESCRSLGSFNNIRRSFLLFHFVDTDSPGKVYDVDADSDTERAARVDIRAFHAQRSQSDRRGCRTPRGTNG